MGTLSPSRRAEPPANARAPLPARARGQPRGAGQWQRALLGGPGRRRGQSARPFLSPGRAGSRRRGARVLFGSWVEDPGAGARGGTSLAGQGAGSPARREVRGSAWSAGPRRPRPLLSPFQPGAPQPHPAPRRARPVLPAPSPGIPRPAPPPVLVTSPSDPGLRLPAPTVSLPRPLPGPPDSSLPWASSGRWRVVKPHARPPGRLHQPLNPGRLEHPTSYAQR